MNFQGRFVDRLHAGLIVLCSLLLLWATQAMADSPPCELNSPVPSESPAGMPSVVFSPVGFDSFETGSKDFAFFDALRSDRYMIVFNLQQYDPDQTYELAELRFLRAGEVVHRCTVKTVDPARSPLSWTYGNCALEVTSGAEVLRPGSVQVVRLAQPILDMNVFPSFADQSRNTMAFSMLSTEFVALIGIRPGPAALVGLSETDDGRSDISICPFLVAEATSASPPEDTELCRDPEGRALRLQPGQRAEIAVDNAGQEKVISQDLRILNDEVVQRIDDDGSKALIIEAKSAGVTSVLLSTLTIGGGSGSTCMIVVE